MKTKTKIILGVIILLLAILAFFGIRLLISVQEYQTAVANIVFEHVDASDIPDGVYFGEYDAQLVVASVEVTIENEAITDIRILEHRNGRGADAEGIVKEMIAQQRIDVDAIAGATNSSTVIKKAVDNALSSAKR